MADAMARENIPTSRVRRSATIGRLAAGEAVKQFGTRAANVTRGDEAAEEALARRQVETAEQIVAVLGTMKGAAMKLGQVMSFLDVGLVPEEYREEFQRKLAELRDAAPTVVLQADAQGDRGGARRAARRVFARLRRGPIAAASIGQVYRATLHDGRAVAVKVQYPGVAERGALRPAEPRHDHAPDQAAWRPGSTSQAIAEEIRARIDEELDYELEAAEPALAWRGIYRGHPFIHVPDVITSLSRERVLVSEYVERHRLRGAQARDRSRARPASARSSSASTSAACTATTSSPATRIPATSCCSTTAASRFLDFGLYKRIDARGRRVRAADRAAAASPATATP